MATFAMHRKTTTAFVQFEPRVWPGQILNSTRSFGRVASRHVEMPPNRRGRGRGRESESESEAAWSDLTFKTLSVTVAARSSLFAPGARRPALPSCNARRNEPTLFSYFDGRPATGARIRGSTFRLLCTYSTNEKYTQAPRTRLRVLRHLRLEVTFPFSTYFNIPLTRAFRAPIYDNDENNGW